MKSKPLEKHFPEVEFNDLCLNHLLLILFFGGNYQVFFYSSTSYDIVLFIIILQTIAAVGATEKTWDEVRGTED